MNKARNDRGNLLGRIMLLPVEMIIVMAFYIASLYLFSLMVKYIFYDGNSALDTAVFQFFNQLESPAATRLMQFVTHLGGPVVLITGNLLLTIWFLFIKKHKWYSVKIVAIALSSTLMMLLLKMFFGRERPLNPLLEPVGGLSFPSGHAMMSFAFYGFLIYLVHKLIKRRLLCGVLITALFLTILLIGASRIYLRVHYPTDVIAGLTLGLLWLTSCIVLLDRIERKSPPSI